MGRLRDPGLYGLLLMAVMASAGGAWGDCVLLAGSVALAYRLFLLWMDRGAPWPPLTAALNALTGGALAGMAGIALLAGIGAAGLGWWQPPAPHPVPALMFIVLSAAWCCWSRHSLAGAMDELKVWLWLVGGTVLAMEAYGRGLAMAPCLFALVIGVAMLWAGWRLVRFTSPAMLRSGSQTP